MSASTSATPDLPALNSESTLAADGIWNEDIFQRLGVKGSVILSEDADTHTTLACEGESTSKELCVSTREYNEN